MMATLKRSDNWSSSEIEVLKQEVDKRRSILFGSFSSTLTKELKKKNWNEITSAINNVSSNSRTVAQVSKKWDNVKSKSKGEIASKMAKKDYSGTGGGPAKPFLSSDEERMLGIIGKTSVVGIDGGIDTSHERDHGVKSNNLTSPSFPICFEIACLPIPQKDSTNYDVELYGNAVVLDPESQAETSDSRFASSSASQPPRKKIKKSLNHLLLDEQKNIKKTLVSMLAVMEKNSVINEERLQIEKDILKFKQAKYNFNLYSTIRVYKTNWTTNFILFNILSINLIFRC